MLFLLSPSLALASFSSLVFRFFSVILLICLQLIEISEMKIWKCMLVLLLCVHCTVCTCSTAVREKPEGVKRFLMRFNFANWTTSQNKKKKKNGKHVVFTQFVFLCCHFRFHSRSLIHPFIHSFYLQCFISFARRMFAFFSILSTHLHYDASSQYNIKYWNGYNDIFTPTHTLPATF